MKFDLATLDITDGTHTVKVNAKADGHINSEFSHEIEYTRVQSFTLTLNYNNFNGGDLRENERIKINLAPTSNDDYDYQASWKGIENKAGTVLGKTITVNNVLKYYTWSNASANNWQTPTEHTDQSYTLVHKTGCLMGDTCITMSNGSEKRIDSLNVGDKILSYNPETGKLEEDEIVYSDSEDNKEHNEYDVYTFDDGTVIKTVHRHRFYNIEQGSMVYMDAWNIGEHAINKDKKLIALISHKNVKETVKHYTIFTKNQNYFANGLLSGNRYTKHINF